MLGDIIRNEDNNFCNDGHWKKSFKDVKDVCYLSVHTTNFNHELIMNKCKYMSGYHKMKVGKLNIYYSKCNYKGGNK